MEVVKLQILAVLLLFSVCNRGIFLSLFCYNLCCVLLCRNLPSIRFLFPLTVLIAVSFDLVGNAQHCTLSDLAVTQTVAPGKVRGQRLYTVAVENRCICTQSNIKVACKGYASTMGVARAILKPDGDGKLCTLNDGRAVGMGPGYAIRFRYSSTSQIAFKPVSSTIGCS